LWSACVRAKVFLARILWFPYSPAVGSSSRDTCRLSLQEGSRGRQALKLASYVLL
jgi:hypothetical protein